MYEGITLLSRVILTPPVVSSSEDADEGTEQSLFGLFLFSFTDIRYTCTQAGGCVDVYVNHVLPTPLSLPCSLIPGFLLFDGYISHLSIPTRYPQTLMQRKKAKWRLK